MIVKRAIEKAAMNKGKDISVMVDVRDILNILEIIDDDVMPDEDKIKQAIYEINEMNIDIPYNLTLVNDMGNIEEFIPIVSRPKARKKKLN